MKIIVGLGNPGLEYAKTRHNMGFCVIDVLADKYFIKVEDRKSRAYVGSGVIEGEKVLLVKPQTFMNLSGEAVGAIANFYKVDPVTDVIVVYDDIALEPGNIRIRKKGSAGGHNGMKNIISHLGTDEFARVRIGVGAKKEGSDLANHVLSRFSKEEIPDIEDGIEKGAEAVAMIIGGKIDEAMNIYNKKTSKEVS